MVLVSLFAPPRGALTIPAGLHRGFNVPDALHGDAVLVVAVDVLVLKLADFVEQHAQLVGHVRDILVAGLAPERELLLRHVLANCQRGVVGGLLGGAHTATSIRSLATNSRLRMTFFSILTSWASFLARSGPNAPAALRRRACPKPPVNVSRMSRSWV